MEGSKCVNLGSVHTLPEKSENGSNVLISIHITPEKFRNATIPVIFELFLSRTRASFVEGLHFQYGFRACENAEPAFSNSSGLKNVFEKLRFRDGSVWTDSWPNRRIKEELSSISLYYTTKLVQRANN